jgi:hypothetical protein
MVSKNKKDSDTLTSDATTATLLKKGERVKRLFIAICKVFRMCKKNKK